MRSCDLDVLTDEELLCKVHAGDDCALDFLMNKYGNFVRLKARKYFLIGADREDIVQEGMIGLFKAIRDYRPDRQSSFKSFADLCITRQIITAIKAATRQKHFPLNSYISLNKPLVEDEYEMTLLDVIDKNKNVNPEELYINREQYDHIGLKLEEALSKFECSVLSYYLQGKSYQEIGAILKKHTKSIDNALQRIKRKVERVLEAIA